jgi:trans-aconitate methyltransferase
MKQNWDANAYSQHASFVPERGAPVLELLVPRQGERVLDLGCGDGVLTEKIARAGADVLGVDASPGMVEAARSRGLSAEIMSGDSLSFDQEFDAVFSNAALHWMTNSGDVIRGVYRSLKPGGRFVAEFGGEGNVHTLVQAMEQVFADHPDFGPFENPWYFPGEDEYQQALESEGFEVRSIERIPRPTPLTSDAHTWLELFANGISMNLTPEQRELFLRETEHLVRPALYRDGKWVADYVRLRFVARRPGPNP